MKRILTAVVLIPLVLLVLFKAPLWLFTLVVGLVAMGAAWEYLKLVDAYGVKSMKTQVLSFIALGTIILSATQLSLDGLEPPVFFRQLIPVSAIFGVLIFPLIALVSAMSSKELPQAILRAALSSLAIPYVVLTLFCLVVLRIESMGLFLIVFMLIVVWSGDIFAYYAGRAFGKHKLAPRISPGKTWEGTIASFIGSVFLAHILFVDHHQIMDALYKCHVSSSATGLPDMDKHVRIMHGLVLGAIVNIAAQAGDLVESMIKRGANVKDSGTLLPGHGGILDRIDALLFAAPVILLYTIVLT